MTGLLHEKEFSRKTFVRGGGAMIVGFSLLGTGFAGAASAAESPLGYLPSTSQLDSYLVIDTSGIIHLKTSQIEVGNGITTGFLQVLAEELSVGMSVMQYGYFNKASLDVVDTWLAANTGGEGGSNAMSGTGPKVRAAGAYAYQALLNLASTNLGVPVASLSASNGVISGGGKSVTYAQLVGGGKFNVTLPSAVVSGGLQQGVAPAKPVSAYTLATTSVPRIDIPDKVTATYTYVQNVRVPGMVHGRLVRPRGQGAYPYNSDVPVSYNPASIQSIPGAQIVHVGNFLGVVAPQEYDAIQAAAQLEVVWNTNPILPGTGNLWESWRAADAAGLVPAAINSNIATATSAGSGFNNAIKTAVHTVSATFKFHYQGHTPIGPACCVADVTPNSATLWSNTQNVEGLVTEVQAALGPNYPAANIRVLFYEGSGSYGNGGVAYDAGDAAAVMSQAVGKPVRLQFMRWDEHGWTHYGPALMTDFTAGTDANGNMVAYQATQFGQPGTSLYTTRELVGSATGNATGNAIPTLGGFSANSENTSPWMKVAIASDGGNWQLVGKTITAARGIFQSGALRAPAGPQTAFGNEQLMDMLAVANAMDPIEFRLQNLDSKSFTNATTNGYQNQRWAGVLQALASAASWDAKVPNQNSQMGTGVTTVTGRGVAIGHHGGAFAGVIANVSVNLRTGKISVTELWGGQDNGWTANPGLVENQIIGNLIMGTSRALCEEMTFNKNQITSLDWVSYPLLRFVDAPICNAVLVSNPTQPALGSGEPPQVSVPAAIANAYFDATGVRIHEAPMTAARSLATLKAAGIKV